MNRRWLAAAVLGLAAVILLLWLARAFIAARFARAYFAQHGVESVVEIGSLGLSGASARFALGPAASPDVSADRIELHFDPLRWTPTVVEVRLVGPVVRARLDADGHLTLGSLQDWIDSLSREQGKSRFVSDDLAVRLTGLRLMLATPGGGLEVNGDAKLVRNLPVSADLRARPARITWQGTALDIRAASLDFSDDHLAARFSGAAKNAGLEARDVAAGLDVTGLTWLAADGTTRFTAKQAHLTFAAAALNALAAPRLDLQARNISAVAADGDVAASAELEAKGSGGLDAELKPLRAGDPALADAVRRNLEHFTFGFAGHAERRGGIVKVALTKPLLLQGAKGGVLRVAMLGLAGKPLAGAAEMSLNGPGLPNARLALRNLAWGANGLTSDAALEARFNFAMLRGVNLAATGALSYRDGRYAFTPASCVRAALAAFHPGASDLARNVRGTVCATGGAPLVTGEGAKWALSGEARGASADLPLATAHAEGVTARLAFEGDGAPLQGLATITTGTLTDRAPSPRFNPLQGTGNAMLANGVWRGKFTLRGGKAKTALGDMTFAHTMATGSGTAHVAAPHIAFTPNGLQPAELSPLLVALRRAEGSAVFSGDFNWTRAEIKSGGTLSIPALDFMTPLGEAHAVKTEIALVSLLPPATAPGQHLAIAKIDWTLPFSAVEARFTFTPASVQLASAATDIAQGHVALGALTVNLAAPGNIAGAAQLTGIALGDLVTASNLGSKVKLTGKVSGSIPFALGPDGFRITNGHIASDGPGRLSVDRSMWAQGEAALSSNAVQDFAYQALENLAFEQMSAELNSVANGRLQVVFHIKGRSDPPTRQVAEVAITDILNGTALYKPIPLPSGTPIDLTLDTSLNFDELLKSYAEAWSKTLEPGVERKP